jgi:hypothetical protein
MKLPAKGDNYEPTGFVTLKLGPGRPGQVQGDKTCFYSITDEKLQDDK